MRPRARLGAAILAGTILLTGALPAASDSDRELDPAERGVPEAADCGPGSRPEPGVQGRVPLRDRESGRSQKGYSCNLEQVGRYQGEGATWVNPFYEHCAYMGTSFAGVLAKDSQGTQVVDASRPSRPRLSANLTSPAMATDTWETLKVNERRGLLAGVSVGPALSGLFFDVYDVSEDCAKPKLLNSVNGTNLTLPANVLGHEGNWAPDGRTYYASGLVAGSITAIDTADPTRPKIVYTGAAGIPANHGFSVSDDGNRLYITRAAPAGVDIVDISAIQRRDPLPVIRQVGSVTWSDGLISQHTIPVTKNGKPYLIAVDEFGSGGVHFIDISDETSPVVTDRLRLEINTPEHVDLRQKDTSGNGLFGYEAHYCSVNRLKDPSRLACGWFQSGVRVFDISDLGQVKEIAYFNPPAQVGKNDQLSGSEHAAGLGTGGLSGLTVSDATNGNIGNPLDLEDALQPANLTTDWCSSPPRFVGRNELWVTCQDNGFLALRFTNGVHG